MRALVQRVTEAAVTVDDELVGSIGEGLCAFIGVTHHDTPADARKLASKLSKLRVFRDDEDRMNRSVLDIGGDVLVVSQFTLYGNTTSGNRPGYSEAARPELAEPLIDLVATELVELGVGVATGRFRADMDVRLLNQGPVTLLLEVGGTPAG